MTKHIIRLIQFILFAFISRVSKAETFYNVKKFKDDVKQIEGPKDVIVNSALVLKEDLGPVSINRNLDLLHLEGDSVYFLGYICTINNNNNHLVSVKKLVLIQYYSNKSLESFLDTDASNLDAKLTDLQEIEARGPKAIKQLFKVNTPWDSVSNSIKLVVDRKMTREEVEDIIQPHNGRTWFPNHTELQIEGPIHSRIVKFISDKTIRDASKLSIECTLDQVDHIGNSEVGLRSSLDELKLTNGAILLAFGFYFSFLKYRMDTLVLDCANFPQERFEQDKEINLLKCDSLVLKNKAINILPLISKASLRTMKWIGMKYKKQDVFLSHILFDFLKCKEILEDYASDRLFWRPIEFLNEFPDNDPYKKLKDIFGIPSDVEDNKKKVEDNKKKVDDNTQKTSTKKDHSSYSSPSGSSTEKDHSSYSSPSGSSAKKDLSGTKKSRSGFPTWAIACILAGLALVILILAILLFRYRRRPEGSPISYHSYQPPNPQHTGFLPKESSYVKLPSEAKT